MRPRKRASRRAWLALLLGTAGLLGLLGAVAAIGVSGRSSTTPTPSTPLSEAQLVDLGRQVYGLRCASCHGVNLEGQPGWQNAPPGGPGPAPPLNANGPSPQRSEEWLIRVIRDGGTAVAPPGYRSGMPAYGAVLSDQEIRALVAYMRSTWPAP